MRCTTPYVLHYAPPLERFRHIINRMAKIPELMRQAEANLAGLAEVWNEVAREENAGNIGADRRAPCGRMPRQSLRMRYDQAAAAALAALNGFNHWLEDHLASKRATGGWARSATRRNFAACWRPARRRRRCSQRRRRISSRRAAEMARLAAPKTVEQALADVARQHATAATYMASAKQALAAATAFVKAKDLLTLPPNANLEVIETPEFMRGDLCGRRVQSGAGAGAEAGRVLLGDADSELLAAGAHRLEAARVQRVGHCSI